MHRLARCSSFTAQCASRTTLSSCTNTTSRRHAAITPLIASSPAVAAIPSFLSSSLHTTSHLSNSPLPVLNDYVRRSYPFPTILESDLPPDYSNYLYYHHQHPNDKPWYKSKLTVDIRDLGLDPTSRMVLREMVGNRYNSKTHQISLVSRNLATPQANENRVFQQLDALMIECRTIGKQMNAEGVYAKKSGHAESNRLLKPVPTIAQATKRVRTRLQRSNTRLRQKMGLPALDVKNKKTDETKALSASALNGDALGMSKEERIAFGLAKVAEDQRIAKENSAKRAKEKAEVQKERVARGNQ